MKLPLWVKDKKGKYHQFPYDLLVTYENGRMGLRPYEPLADPRWIELLEHTRLSEYFSYSARHDRWELKEKRTKKRLKNE